MADEEFANAWEVCLSICSVSSCLSCVCDAVFLVWYVFVIGTLSYHNLVEVSRQAVVYVFCEKGFDARIKATEVAAKRVIVQKKNRGHQEEKDWPGDCEVSVLEGLQRPKRSHQKS